MHPLGPSNASNGRLSDLVFLFASLVSAQAVPTASRRGDFQIGVAGTAFTLDYGDGYEEGLAVYGDFDISHRLGLEAIYRNASIRTPFDIGEDHALIGPRYHIERGRFSPYAKALFGAGTINFQKGYNLTSHSETYFTYALGGGVDFAAARHVNVRLFDFEYQTWAGFPRTASLLTATRPEPRTTSNSSTVRLY